MKAYTELPTGYRQIFSVNLQKDKNIMLLINIAAVVIAVVLAVPMHFHIAITAMFNMDHGFLQYILRFIVLIAGIIIYTVLHELLHGITMKLCGTKKIKYGFTGMYAFAGSDDFYDKRSYISIALVPVVVLGIILVIVNAFVTEEWFWTIYIIQILNISGASGDFYVTYKFIGFPKDILVNDCGVEMRVYSAEFLD